MSKWINTKLSDIVDLVHGYQFRDTDFVVSGIPVIKINNVINSGLKLSELSYVSESRLKEFEDIVLKNGDILMSLTGNIGRVVEVKELSQPVFQNYRVGRFEPKDDRISKPYLKYLLSQGSIFQQLAKYANQSAQANFGKQDMNKLIIDYPEDKSEQTHIAEILSKSDEAIAQTEALIAKYQRIKTGLMQDLLTKGIDEKGNIRSKATHKFVFKNGIRVPEEWEVDIIDNVSKVTKLAGYEFTKYFNYSIGGAIIALRALNIKNEEIVLDDIQTIPKKVSDQLPRSKINKGDVLITYIGAYIGDVLLINENDKYHLAPNIAKITAGKKLSPEFLEIVLRTHTIQKQIKNLTAVTATPSLTMGQIRKITIPFPTKFDEQERIIEVIRSIKLNIKDEQNKLSKLQSIKTGLMQDLLSGNVRIN